MPAKSHGRKRYNQRKPVEKATAVETGVQKTVEVNATVAAPSPAVKQAARPASSTQPAPRRLYVRQELLRVAIVSVITLAILIVLVIVLR
mgnify:CR=1 FL=1